MKLYVVLTEGGLVSGNARVLRRKKTTKRLLDTFKIQFLNKSGIRKVSKYKINRLFRKVVQYDIRKATWTVKLQKLKTQNIFKYYTTNLVKISTASAGHNKTVMLYFMIISGCTLSEKIILSLSSFACWRVMICSGARSRLND